MLYLCAIKKYSMYYILLECDGFTCTNGLCISSRETCDGTDHCGDNSDETTICGEYINK